MLYDSELHCQDNGAAGHSRAKNPLHYYYHNTTTIMAVPRSPAQAGSLFYIDTRER